MSKPQWNEDALGRFWHYVAQRQQAFYRRKVLRAAPPWCSDPIVQGNHFTNVYRELDPGTQWLRWRILGWEGMREFEKAFLVIAYRLFGTEEIFEHLLTSKGGYKLLPEAFDGEWLVRSLEQLREEGKPAFTTAYMVSNCNSNLPKTRVVATSLGMLADGWRDTWKRIEQLGSRQEVWSVLTSYYGIGVFVAFQAIVDMCYDEPQARHSPLLPFSNDDWVYAGTSAVSGLKALLGAHASSKIAPGVDDTAIADLVRRQRSPLASRGMRWLTDPKGQPILLDRSNMQNCVCEFGKYEKVRLSKRSGRLRRFDPEAAWQRDRAVEERRGSLAGAAVQVDLTDLIT